MQSNKIYLNEWELQYLRVERLSVIMLSALDKFKFLDQCTQLKIAMFVGRLKINKFSKFVSKYKGQGAKV